MHVTHGKGNTLSLDQIQRLFDTKAVLEQEIADLRHQREDLRRFLDIDAEKAELDRLRAERDRILARAEQEAMEIREAASGVSVQTVADAKQEAAHLLADAAAAIDLDRNTILSEARQAAVAMRGEAERVLQAARKSAMDSERECADRMQALTQSEAAARDRTQECDRREATLLNREGDLNLRLAEVRARVQSLRTALVDW